MRHESFGAVHTHTHTHTHTHVSLIEEKRVAFNYSIYAIGKVVRNNLIIKFIDRILFCKQNNIFLKASFLKLAIFRILNEFVC